MDSYEHWTPLTVMLNLTEAGVDPGTSKILLEHRFQGSDLLKLNRVAAEVLGVVPESIPVLLRVVSEITHGTAPRGQGQRSELQQQQKQPPPPQQQEPPPQQQQQELELELEQQRSSAQGKAEEEGEFSPGTGDLYSRLDEQRVRLGRSYYRAVGLSQQERQTRDSFAYSQRRAPFDVQQEVALASLLVFLRPASTRQMNAGFQAPKGRWHYLDYDLEAAFSDCNHPLSATELFFFNMAQANISPTAGWPQATDQPMTVWMKKILRLFFSVTRSRDAKKASAHFTNSKVKVDDRPVLGNLPQKVPEIRDVVWGTVCCYDAMGNVPQRIWLTGKRGKSEAREVMRQAVRNRQGRTTQEPLSSYKGEELYLEALAILLIFRETVMSNDAAIDRALTLSAGDLEDTMTTFSSSLADTRTQAEVARVAKRKRLDVSMLLEGKSASSSSSSSVQVHVTHTSPQRNRTHVNAIIQRSPSAVRTTITIDDYGGGTESDGTVTEHSSSTSAGLRSGNTVLDLTASLGSDYDEYDLVVPGGTLPPVPPFSMSSVDGDADASLLACLGETTGPSLHRGLSNAGRYASEHLMTPLPLRSISGQSASATPLGTAYARSEAKKKTAHARLGADNGPDRKRARVAGESAPPAEDLAEFPAGWRDFDSSALRVLAEENDISVSLGDSPGMLLAKLSTAASIRRDMGPTSRTVMQDRAEQLPQQSNPPPTESWYDPPDFDVTEEQSMRRKLLAVRKTVWDDLVKRERERLQLSLRANAEFRWCYVRQDGLCGFYAVRALLNERKTSEKELENAADEYFLIRSVLRKFISDNREQEVSYPSLFDGVSNRAEASALTLLFAQWKEGNSSDMLASLQSYGMGAESKRWAEAHDLWILAVKKDFKLVIWEVYADEEGSQASVRAPLCINRKGKTELVVIYTHCGEHFAHYDILCRTDSGAPFAVPEEVIAEDRRAKRAVEEAVQKEAESAALASQLQNQ